MPRMLHVPPPRNWYEQKAYLPKSMNTLFFAMKKFEGYSDLFYYPFQEQCHFGEVPLFMITLHYTTGARAAMG